VDHANDKQSYNYLWKGGKPNFTLDEIVDHYLELTSQTYKVLGKLGLDTAKVVVRDALLEIATLDYFADIDRAMAFHPMQGASLEKANGYGISWFLRRKPIQIVGELLGDSLYINEMVAANILFYELLFECGIDYNNAPNRNKLIEFWKLLFYNFKYRLYTPQSLELAINAFLAGAKNAGHAGNGIEAA
jgi:hypothetical protein